jgi:hypothetical protein
LEQNLDKVNWYNLAMNSNLLELFTRLDCEAMRNNCKAFAEELAAYVFHPVRLERFTEKYNISVFDYMDSV